MSDFVYDLAGLEPPNQTESLSFCLDCLPGVPCYTWQDTIGKQYLAICSLHNSLKSLASSEAEARQLLSEMAKKLLDQREPSRLELRTAKSMADSESLLIASPTKSSAVAWLKTLASLGLTKGQKDMLWLLGCSLALQSGLVDSQSKAAISFQTDLCQHSTAWEQKLISEASQLTNSHLRGSNAIERPTD